MASQWEPIKWVPGTRFLVDGFRFQHPSCRAYFLTHCHSDHTTGLTRSYSAGPIFCSPVTARVLRHDFGLRPDCLRILEPDQPATICGVEVTPIDANHCPGAVMFLFKVPASNGGKTQTILHTGDLRWHAGMAAHPALRALPARQLDVLMLDTTYCHPKWCFPPQADAVALMAQKMAGEAEASPATLFVVGSYHIGKERAYLGAAAQLGWRVYCTPAKQQLLRLLGLPRDWLALLTDVPEEAQIHVLSMGEQLHEQALTERIAGTQWQRVVAIKPTGWTYRRKGGLDVRVMGCVTLLGIPYSEHSSYEELRDCVRRLRPKRLIPTVNAADAAKSRKIVDCFADLMDLSADRSRLDCYLRRPACAAQPGRQQEQQAGEEQQQREERQQQAGEEQQQAEQQAGEAGCPLPDVGHSASGEPPPRNGSVDPPGNGSSGLAWGISQPITMPRSGLAGSCQPPCGGSTAGLGSTAAAAGVAWEVPAPGSLQATTGCDASNHLPLAPLMPSSQETAAQAGTAMASSVSLITAAAAAAAAAVEKVAVAASGRAVASSTCLQASSLEVVELLPPTPGIDSTGAVAGAAEAVSVAAAAPAAAGEVVDLAAIDVAQQQRILAMIQASSCAGSSGGGGGGSRKRPPGSGAGLKQGSLKRFFSASPPST